MPLAVLMAGPYRGIELKTLRYSPLLIAMVLAATPARANDLKDLYELALMRDASLQAAGFQRDAAIEARPQALAQWLPQL